VSKCWICETEYEGECPNCGPPQPWGPTPEEEKVTQSRFEPGTTMKPLPDSCPDCGGKDFSTSYDGLVRCEDCGCIVDDSNYEPPEPDGECFRGREAESYQAEQQAWIQRNLK
jgi:uncharacterized Zn finger protein (UPF0148 family)